MHPNPLKFFINTKFSDQTLPRAAYSEHHQYSWGEMHQRAQCSIQQLSALQSEFWGKDFSIATIEIVVAALGGGFVEETKQQSLLCKETPVRSASWCAQSSARKKEKEKRGREVRRGKRRKKTKGKQKKNKLKRTWSGIHRGKGRRCIRLCSPFESAPFHSCHFHWDSVHQHRQGFTSFTLQASGALGEHAHRRGAQTLGCSSPAHHQPLPRQHSELWGACETETALTAHSPTPQDEFGCMYSPRIIIFMLHR